jgi:PAS domain S-box-containing protein
MIGHTSLELGIWKQPEQRDRFIAELGRTGRVRNFEMSLGTRAGEVRTILLNGEAIRLGTNSCFLSVLRDVTDRRLAEQALRESEEKFSKAFRTSPDVMSIVDLETGHYLEVNEAHGRAFGFTRAEVIGRSPVELGIFDGPDRLESLQRQLAVSGSFRNEEIQACNRAGERLTFLLSAEVMELGGRKCLLRVAHDITRRKLAEAEREVAIQREQEARIKYTLQLIASQEAERKRIAAELHDSVGQNIVLIRNLAQQALQVPLAEEVREQLATIDHLAGLCIADVRQISRDLRPYQLDHLGLKRALESMVEHVAQASSVEFTAQLESADDLFSSEAAMNIYRIVQESLNNIVKHARARHAHVAMERDIHEVRLRVEDDGGGFAAEPAGGKDGLGLRNIAERARMLGGKLDLQSTPGRGTRVEVRIPIPEPAG